MCAHASLTLEGSISIEDLRGSELADSCQKNGASFPGTVQLDSTWLSLREICINRGAPPFGAVGMPPILMMILRVQHREMAHSSWAPAYDKQLARQAGMGW